MISIGKHCVFYLIGLFMAMACALPTSIMGGTNNLTPADTVDKPVLVITPRLHSTGYFPFSGSLINHHLNTDINIFYSRKVFGFFIFKSYDIADPHSIINYLQPGVFATVRLHPAFRVRGFFGYIFSQTEHFRDTDSDYYTALSLYWDVSSKVRIEHTALYYDYTTNKKLANRLLVSWSGGKFKIDVYVWHRAVLDERRSAVSSALALTFPSITLSDRVTLQFTSSYMGYLSKDKPDYELRDGFLFTLAMPIKAVK
jgi:hypothetical protein